MKNNFRIENGILRTNSFSRSFNYPIGDVKLLNNVYIVLLKLPKGSKEVDNVYGVDKAGKIIWRIQSIKDAFGIMQNTPYVSVDIDEIKNLSVTNFFGMKYYVNFKDGTLREKECIHW